MRRRFSRRSSGASQKPRSDQVSIYLERLGLAAHNWRWGLTLSVSHARVSEHAERAALLCAAARAVSAAEARHGAWHAALTCA
eukprot:357436-Chlamydomonas_euryale.AAC.2